MIIIGIDPGLSGGLAVLNNGQLIAVFDMPTIDVPYKNKTRKEVDPFGLHKILFENSPDMIVVESVNAFKGQGVTSMFRFGESFGIIKGVAASYVFSQHLLFVKPQAWKRKMNLLKTEKDDARLRCIEIFSSHSDWFKLKKHSGRADAALIALASYLNWMKE
jgi:crossover junction endodeoxyribonuclease RuvC